MSLTEVQNYWFSYKKMLSRVAWGEDCLIRTDWEKKPAGLKITRLKEGSSFTTKARSSKNLDPLQPEPSADCLESFKAEALNGFETKSSWRFKIWPPAKSNLLKFHRKCISSDYLDGRCIAAYLTFEEKSSDFERATLESFLGRVDHSPWQHGWAVNGVQVTEQSMEDQ